MTNNYSSNLDFIAHAGRGHDDNPPGRGSGRYAWGSGAKWGKTVNRVKGFFKKKKPAENRVEVSQAKREVNTSSGAKSQQKDNSIDMSKLDKSPVELNLTKSERDILTKKFKNDVDDEETRSLIQKAYGKSEWENPGTEKIARQIAKDELAEVNAKEQKSAESHEADRKTALESGDRKQILKYFQESSNEELQRAIIKAGMMDSLNKSISDSKPKIQSAEDLAKTQKEEYIKAALASGDKKQIFLVASDPSVTNNDLVNALNKVNTINNLNKQLNPSKFDKTIEIADKLKSVLDKSLGYYNTTSNVWNILAANYNNSQAVKDNPTKALGYMMQIPNLNQKKDVKKS